MANNIPIQKMTPFFSIIIPTYNRAHLISKAIESVISQTFKDWELIIVDDGSTDNTKELIYFYQENEPRIRYIFQENAERSAARNKGIENSIGKYVCFLDSDDYYLDKRLQGVFDYISNLNIPKCFFYTAITYDYCGKLVERTERSRGNENVYDFIVQATIGTPQVILSKEILCKERFDPRWCIGEDMELWMRLANYDEPHFIQNQATIVAVEHEDRSVNLRQTNAAKEQLKTLNHIFFYPCGKKISVAVRKLLLSNCHFNIARFYMYKSEKLRAFLYLFKSIIIDTRNEQLKHRIYCLASLVRLTIPQEYQIKHK